MKLAYMEAWLGRNQNGTWLRSERLDSNPDESKFNLFGMMGEFLCEEELEKTCCRNVYSKP